jgi:hypothetical protein
VTAAGLLAVAWWAPLAIVGGALGGAAIGYLLLVATGGSRRPPAESRGQRTPFARAEDTSDLAWNPAAFLAVGAAVAIIVGLAIGLSAD